MRRLVAALALAGASLGAGAQLPPYAELRYCGAPPRTAEGRIQRRADVTAAFRRLHPCPVTLSTGRCPGWAINHVIPLACGGCDAVSNLQWLPVGVKAQVDAFERRINAAVPPVPGTAGGCINQVVESK